MKVPFLDLRRLHESINRELQAAFDEVVEQSAFVSTAFVGRFESAFAAAHQRRAGAACGSGTDALALALRCLGIGSGDEVVVPSMTFVATAEAVVHAGAIPVIADVDDETLLLSPSTVDRVRTARTRAVIPVHLYGHVVPFTTLEAWRESGLIVVEDAAQAHLATWEGRPVGSIGAASCFSFYPGKNLGALGDAGIVLTDDTELAAAIRSLRDHGRSQKYVHDQIGWCSRMDGLQAALLHAKLGHLASWTAARRRLADSYRVRLFGAEGVRLVPWDDGAVHHLLVIRLPAGRRTAMQQVLSEAGIGTAVHYPVPLSQQPSMKRYATTCHAAEAAATEVLSLPMDPLMTKDEVDEVCNCLLGALP